MSVNPALSILGAMAMGGWLLHHWITPDVPSATFILSTGGIPKGSYIVVQAFANEACERHPDGARLAFFGTKRLQRRSDPHDGVERRVRAGHPIVVSYIFQARAAGFTDTLRCRNTVSFVPRLDGRYRLHYEMDFERCEVSALRVDGHDPNAIDGFHRVDRPCNDMLRG